MKTGLDRKALGMAAVLLGVGVLVSLCLHVHGQLRRELAHFDQVLELQLQTQRVYMTLLDMETSQRGYLLTQADTYLVPYRAGLQRLPAEVERLSALAAGMPDRAADLSRLRALMDTKQAELAQGIEQMQMQMQTPTQKQKQMKPQPQGDGTPAGPVRGDQAPSLMDDIGTALTRMNATEAHARARRATERDAMLQRAEAFAALLAGAMGLLLLALALMFRRDKALRAQLHRADETARQQLEHRVADRTAQLEAASHALTLGKARLQGIFASATDAILTTDAHQVIVEANASAAQLFGCSHADLIGAPLERVIPERFQASHRRDVEAFGAGEDHARRMGQSREVVGLRADGTEFPIDAGISHVEVDGERLYTVILRDITQRRQAEWALRDSKAKLETALASMNDAVCICDATGSLLEFNDAFATFYGFSSRNECRERLAAQPAIVACCFADGTPAPQQQWALPRALRGETAANAEYLLRRTDTGRTWVGSFSFAPIRSADGLIVGAVVSCRDITSIKRVQTDLAASHAMLQRLLANQHRVQEEERKRIARELHDDLQQSLAAIRMDTVAVGERLSSGRSDVQPLLMRIDRLSAAAISSTRRIVSDLRPEMLEELGLVAALETMCAQHAERTGADCQLRVLPGASEAQLGSSAVVTGLYRIAQEALNNVAKHARATAVNVTLGCSHEGLVTLRVSDNGVGVDEPGKRRPGSFGLQGMAERARALGGQLRIESRAHAGTSIEVLVPTFAAGSTAADAADPPEADRDAAPGPALPAHGTSPPDLLDEWGQPLQAVIDALAGPVSVLDRRGVILMVNRAWREFAARNGVPDLSGCGPGVSYVEVCRRSAERDPSASPILQGLDAVLQGRQAAFSAEYPCETADGRLWFRMHAATVTGGLALVTHVDLSSGATAADAHSGTPPANAPI